MGRSLFVFSTKALKLLVLYAFFCHLYIYNTHQHPLVLWEQGLKIDRHVLADHEHIFHKEGRLGLAWLGFCCNGLLVDVSMGEGGCAGENRGCADRRLGHPDVGTAPGVRTLTGRRRVAQAFGSHANAWRQGCCFKTFGCQKETCGMSRLVDTHTQKAFLLMIFLCFVIAGNCHRYAWCIKHFITVLLDSGVTFIFVWLSLCDVFKCWLHR